ncbi:MAG: lytic transglycosylase, partial [Acidobacteria bacterium]
MRFVDLHVRTALLVGALLGVCACHSAQKPVAVKPPANPPALQPSTKDSATTAQEAKKPGSEQQQAASEPAQNGEQSSRPEPAASLAPISDPVTLLVDNAEKKYQEGLTQFHAGKQDQAKQNFDEALNSLLSSNLDVRSDARLQKEFDHIVQGVNELYPGGTAADVEQAEAQEPQQKSEPAPIDQTNELSPSADARTKAKAEADVKNTRSDLPLMMTDQVAGFIAYFSNHGRGIFERALARSGRYREMMLPILKEEGVPQDLIYLAQAESGFHALAVSRVGARGIWQFMGSRARGYGMHHNVYVDDRQDPEKSTRAAARHLKDLYNQFGDWYLAMAAYNSGPGTVQAAVKRTGYADFWELYNRNVLPKETKNYVPIILAVTIMAKNPAQYGL